MASGVYCYKNLINGKIYVGRTKDLKKRKREHEWCYSHDNNRYNKYLYKEMRIYGLNNFEYSVLEYCDESKLDEREMYYVSLFDSSNEDKGYNLNRGGRTGNLNQSKRVYKVDIKTKNVIDEYISIGEAAKENNLFITGIWSVCVGKASQSGGYYWCYADEYENFVFKKPVKKGHSERPVYQIDKSDNIVAEYESVREASISLGRKKSAIRNCLAHLSETAYGYKWEYKEV